MEKAQIFMTRQESHPEIGNLTITVVSQNHSHEQKALVQFELEALHRFFLRRYETSPSQDTLDYDCYQAHSFSPGEKWQWCTLLPACVYGQIRIGPWKLHIEKKEEIVWEIPAMEINVLPPLQLKHTILAHQNDITKLKLSLKNLSQSNIPGLYMEIIVPCEEGGISSLLVLSGPSRVSLDLSSQEESEYYLLNVQGSGILEVHVHQEDLLLLEEKIPILKKQTLKTNSDKKSVDVLIYDDVTKKEIKPKGGYYYVSSNRDINVTINPANKNYVPTLKDVEIHHPNICLGSTGKLDDRVFNYTMKFLVNNPFTTKLSLLYTVKYDDGETNSQVIPFKLKASGWGLLLLSLLFILPNMIESFLSMYPLEEQKGIWLLVLCGLCVCLPFLYDYVQNRF